MRAKVMAVLQVLAATVVGTASGFFSGGLSAIPSAGEAIVTVAESKGKIRQRTATGLRLGLGAVGAVLSVVNPLGLATSAASVGARAISAGAGLVVKGVIEAATWGGRFTQRLKAKFGAKKRLNEGIRKQIKGFDKTKLKKVGAKAAKN